MLNSVISQSKEIPAKCQVLGIAAVIVESFCSLMVAEGERVSR